MNKPVPFNTNAHDLLRSQGFVVAKLPVSSLQNTFDDLPRDLHSPGRIRTIRLSQFFVYRENGIWIAALLPRRPYVQSSDYIKLAEAGGVLRHRDQLKFNSSSLISNMLDYLPLDYESSYHVNVNQIRITVNADYKGITVPEGPHSDGFEYSVIAIADRHNISGGETQIIDPETNEVLFSKMLDADEAIFIDDERLFHYATEICPIEGHVGWRDIFAFEISRWDKRQYGPLHEIRAAGFCLESAKTA